MPGPVLNPAVLDTLRSLTAPGEPDVLTDVLQLFLADVPGRIARLNQAWQSGDAAAVQRVAHSLKGSAGNIGATDLSAVCRELDAASQSGDLSTSEPLIMALATEYARVESEIRRLIG